jgi:hypothetical protein
LAALHGIIPFAGGQKDKWQHKKQHSHLASDRGWRGVMTLSNIRFFWRLWLHGLIPKKGVIF